MINSTKFEPGEESGSTEEPSPLTRFLTEPVIGARRVTRWFETTLSHQGERVKKKR